MHGTCTIGPGGWYVDEATHNSLSVWLLHHSLSVMLHACIGHGGWYVDHATFEPCPCCCRCWDDDFI